MVCRLSRRSGTRRGEQPPRRSTSSRCLGRTGSGAPCWTSMMRRRIPAWTLMRPGPSAARRPSSRRRSGPSWQQVRGRPSRMPWRSCAAKHRTAHALLFMLMGSQQLAGSSALTLSSSQVQQRAEIWVELSAGTIDYVAQQAGLWLAPALSHSADVKAELMCIGHAWRAALSCCCWCDLSVLLCSGQCGRSRSAARLRWEGRVLHAG